MSVLQVLGLLWRAEDALMTRLLTFDPTKRSEWLCAAPAWDASRGGDMLAATAIIEWARTGRIG